MMIDDSNDYFSTINHRECRILRMKKRTNTRIIFDFQSVSFSLDRNNDSSMCIAWFVLKYSCYVENFSNKTSISILVLTLKDNSHSENDHFGKAEVVFIVALNYKYPPTIYGLKLTSSLSKYKRRWLSHAWRHLFFPSFQHEQTWQMHDV